MYFRTRLFSYKKRWRLDIPYLLHAATSYDLLQLKHDINTYLKIAHQDSSQQTPITAGYIQNNTHNPDFIKNSYMFMKNIRGTVPYFKNALQDLLAMLDNLGPPTLFLTFSADD